MHAIIALYALLVLIYKRLGIRFIVFDSVTADKAAVSDTNAINSETDVQTVKRNYTPVMVSFIIFGVGLLFGFGIGPQILANGFTPALQMAWSDGTILFLSIFGCLFIGVPLFLMRYVQDPE